MSLALVGCASGGGKSTAEGTWGSGGEGSPQLVLADDGSLSGTDGCNNLFGSWKQDGDKVEFGQVGSTMMYCEGVDTWLSGIKSGEVSGDELAIFDIDENEIGSLTRQE